MTSLTQFLVPCMNMRVTGKKGQLKGERGHGMSVCDEDLGLSPVKVGATELTLSRDCLPPTLLACPVLFFLQWPYVPAPTCPLRVAGARLLARYRTGRQTSVFVQDRPLYPAVHVCAPGSGTWASMGMPHACSWLCCVTVGMFWVMYVCDCGT